MFITFEGIEGVGKSTQLRYLEAILNKAGIPVVMTREPGGTTMGEEIRDILLAHRNEHVVPVTELLLMFAARTQHVDTVIKPALAQGNWVLCDRFVDATYAYQGGGRNIPMETIRQLEMFALGAFKPDQTLILDAPPEIGLGRIKGRGARDRIEKERADFFTRVRETYLNIAEQESERCCLIDATQPLEVVRRRIEALAVSWINA